MIWESFLGVWAQRAMLSGEKVDFCPIGSMAHMDALQSAAIRLKGLQISQKT
jgi:hypothetical protein